MQPSYLGKYTFVMTCKARYKLLDDLHLNVVMQGELVSSPWAAATSLFPTKLQSQYTLLKYS